VPAPYKIIVSIGGLPIVIGCRSAEFIEMLQKRYANFIAGSHTASTKRFVGGPRRTDNGTIRLEVELSEPHPTDDGAEEDFGVRFEGSCWVMRRGDFVARWNPTSGSGVIRQAAYPYAIDSVMRIIHSLVLARSSGFLLHSASAIRCGRAFLFTGVSGAGKTTVARLAPPDAALLTDEVSYVRRIESDYYAFGTPFAGELGIPGEDVAAPIAAVYFLRKGQHNQVAPIDARNGIGPLLRNVLFFTNDGTLTKQLFDTVCDFAAKVPLCELTFEPKQEVWDLVA
jgi:hypothetical protein